MAGGRGSDGHLIRSSNDLSYYLLLGSLAVKRAHAHTQTHIHTQRLIKVQKWNIINTAMVLILYNHLTLEPKLHGFASDNGVNCERFTDSFLLCDLKT